MMVGNNKNISIFSNRNFYYSQDKKDSVVKGIEKQIKIVQKQMVKISENESLSAEQKLDMKKDLREQLDELNEQLMKRNMEVQKQEREKKEEKLQKQVQNQSIQDEYTVNDSEGVNLISLSSSLKQVSIQNAVNTKMKGQARVLASEIKLDEGRGLDVTNKKEELSQTNSKIENINKQIQNTLKDVNDKIKKGNEQVKEKEDKTDKTDKRVDENKVEEKQKEKTAENSKTSKPTKKIDVYI
ncbi:hypothetical protein CLOACE_21460 [Clostridium acetireducens DSM 10703]|jgi:hypothetical protein|uniref:Uncharacterized protein n=1 Tax=Clostridium acetireducens DSM 10703 TaxID=1121290 RepID=A0A1E8EVX7_9CLOT|nr:FlxA-like family protein [Clostridium acetireducens]OFI01421.1 hypothetical protein CLOACE_21460 [Clostridium acetireducens DSM 10703]